jgi:GMP synthase-like glutamine amidotransferase
MHHIQALQTFPCFLFGWLVGEPRRFRVCQQTGHKNMFCVVCCENSAIWSPIDFVEMFKSKLAQNSSDWIAVNVANNENLPENIESFQGIVFTGSRFNICDRSDYPWFDNVCEFIRTAARTGKPRIYGGCFGCQLIGHALGGEVSRNPFDRFILKAESIELIYPACLTIFPDLNPAKTATLTLIESHGYCVSTLPPDALLIASSPSCTSEMFVCGANKNLLACQSHPEFEFGYAIRDRIWPAVVEKFQRLSREEIVSSEESFKDFSGADSDFFCALVSSFLHSH